MHCIDCDNYRFLTNEGKDVYGYCSKKKKNALPYDLCRENKKAKEEMEIVEYYVNHYEEQKLEEIIKSLGIRGLDKARLNYLITKHFLPRKLWGE